MEPKNSRNTWLLLGSMLVIVGGLLVTWVVRFDNTLANDRAKGQSANLPFGKIQEGFQTLTSYWEEKTGLFSALDDLTNTEGDEQNEGQTGQLTNAGLTNEQIDSIEKQLFEHVAPEE